MPLFQGLVESILTTPGDTGPAADVAPLREAGLSDEEIADAIHVSTAFNLINRTADALGWEMQKDVAVYRFAEFLLKAGYK